MIVIVKGWKGTSKAAGKEGQEGKEGPKTRPGLSGRKEGREAAPATIQELDLPAIKANRG